MSAGLVFRRRGVSWRGLFGTDGVRGVANDDLTPELAFRLGEAAGHFLGERRSGRIVVGRTRESPADMLEAALVAGVCSGGASAARAGMVPTPAVAFLTRELGADGGVVISASHNPGRVQRHQVLQPRRLQAAR